MNINILEWINNSNHKEIAEELLLGPQEEVLESLQQFNEIYQVDLGVTKQFRWKPGTYAKYKDAINKIQMFNKRCNSLQRIHYRIGDTGYRLNRMKSSITDIESQLWRLRNEGFIFQDNTEPLENGLQVLQACLEEHNDIECRIHTDNNTNSKLFTLRYKLSEQDLFIKTRGSDTEPNNVVMKFKYPFDVKVKISIGLTQFLNNFVSSIENPEKTRGRLNANYQAKLLNNTYRVKHPYINRGYISNYNNENDFFDENNSYKEYIYMCVGNLQTELNTLFTKFDLLNLKWMLEKWNSNFVFNVTNPLNNTRKLYHGEPEFITEEYKTVRGSTNDADNCTYINIWEHIPEGEEHYCDKYKCSLRENCFTYRTNINFTITPEEEALICEISALLNDEETEILRQYKRCNNSFAKNVKELHQFLSEIEDITVEFSSLIWDYWSYCDEQEDRGNLGTNIRRRTRTRAGILYDCIYNCMSIKPKILNPLTVFPDNNDKIRLNNIYKAIYYDLESLVEETDNSEFQAAWTLPYPDVDEPGKGYGNSTNDGSDVTLNEPLPTGWAEYMANRNRRPV